MIESALTQLAPATLPPRTEESAGSRAAALTRDLFVLLTQLRTRRAPRAGRGAARRGARVYRDRDFEYVEVAAPGLDDVEADICIHGGRIFIRVPR